MRGLSVETNNYLGIIRHLDCVCKVRIGYREGLRLFVKSRRTKERRVDLCCGGLENWRLQENRPR